MNIANPDSAGKFDFSQIIDRKGKDALSLEVIPFNDAEVKKGFSKIPMWIADMNFATAPTILDHITSRARHPAFGYFQPSDEYFDCIVNWQKQRNGVMDIPREAIGYENGVLGCFSSVLQAFTAPGDPVLFHAPTYIGFQAVMKTNGRRIVTSELIRDNDGVFRIDFEDCEKKIRENHIHLVVFCSPHNPTGRVWEKEEIARFCEICQQNNCIIFSDEIWSDLILKNYKHTPTQSVSEDAKMRTIAAYAPSKTFNLAGLIGSYHIIYNETLREIVKKRSDMSFYNNMNVLSMHALTYRSAKEARAQLVAEGFDGERIALLDSWTTSGGLDFLIQRARRLIVGGASLEEAVSELEGARARQGIVFTVPRLDVLKRSGRLGATRRAVAGKLDRYLIMVLDQGGIRDVDVAHGTTAVARSLVKQVPEGARDGLLIVTGYGNSETTGAVVECIQRRLPQAEVSVRDGGPVVSLHLGVGSVSLAWDVPGE